MKISIIIPCFKSSEIVKKMLKSIESNFRNIDYEIILVDDSQDENEYQLLCETSKLFSNTEVIDNKQKKGAGTARNLGLSYATGEWLLFADSDDHFTENAGSYLKEHLSSKTDIVLFIPTSTMEDGTEGLRHQTFKKHFDVYKESYDLSDLRFSLPYVWSKLFRREFIEKNNIQFDEVIVNNDVMFALKSGNLAESIIIDERTIYSWDYMANSLTTNVSKERFRVRAEVLVSLKKYLQKNTNYQIYLRYRPSATKLIITSIFRYKYGLAYSIKLASYLLYNGLPLIKKKDISFYKAINFFKNNTNYKSNR